MRLIPVLVAVAGLGVAAGSAQLARDLLLTPAAEAASGAGLATVVTASRDIRRGDVLQAQDFTVRSWPRDALPAEAFTQVAPLLPTADGPPRRATRPMVAGEVVLASKVSDFGEKITIVQSLAAGARAMAVKVDAVTAVGGLVTPGDFVDILLTRDDGGSLVTDTILRRIKVIAVDQSSDELTEVPDIAATVTVEVDPEQGQVLALAQRAGALSLALRTPDATDGPPVERLRLSDLIAGQAPAARAAPLALPVVAVPSPRRTVLERRGTDTLEVTLRN